MRDSRTTNHDYFERASRAFTFFAFGVALVASLVTPLLAIQWANRPFLGLLVEPTLVVTGTSSAEWSGWSAGVRFPQHIVRLAGVPVASPMEYDAVLLAKANVVGQRVRLLTQLPDGSQQLYPSIRIGKFPPRQLLRFFGWPYAVGLAYLAIGAWAWRARGHTRTGLGLAFFCFCTAIACFLMFDLSTTHIGPAVWTTALALTGGALLSLALRFPEEWRLVKRRPWLLFVPYGPALLLAGAGLIALTDGAHPWAYLDGWRNIYTYTGLAIMTFLGVMVYRTVRGRSPLARQQAGIVVIGSLLSFAPITAWLLAPVLKLSLTWDLTVFMPELLLFPLSLALAIFRYRLLDAEIIVNRTLVYGTVTAVLAGAFAISVGLWQKLFVELTGEKSDTAIIITSLLVASAFSPLKSHLQAIVDRRLRRLPDDTSQLQSFGADLRAHAEMREAEHVARRLLEEAVRALHAECGAVSLVTAGQMQTVHTHGPWKGEAWLCLPLESGGRRFGLLSLGPRQQQKPYGRDESEILQQVTLQAARTIGLNVEPWPPGTLPLGGAGLMPQQVASSRGTTHGVAQSGLPAVASESWEKKS